MRLLPEAEAPAIAITKQSDVFGINIEPLFIRVYLEVEPIIDANCTKNGQRLKLTANFTGISRYVSKKKLF